MASSGAEGLSLVVFSGGFERVHYALVMASAAAASNRRATLFFTGRALRALVAEDGGAPGWHRLDPAEDGSPPAARDEAFQARGVAGFEELLEACAALGVAFMVCEMGMRAEGIEAARLRPDVPVRSGGVVTLLNETPAAGAPTFV